MKSKIKQLIKKPLRAIGYDIYSLSRHTHPLLPNRLWLRELGVKTVLDVGANAGQFALQIQECLPQAMVYSFEPLSEPFAALKEQMHGAKRWRGIQVGLGAETAQLNVHKNAYSPSSSILPMTSLHREAFPHTAQELGVERVHIRRLDDVVSEINVEEPIFLKIDVQGYEMNVLRGAEETLRRSEVVLVETSFTVLYEGEPLFEEMHTAMQRAGFAYCGNWDQLPDPRDGRILQADAIFRKAGR